MEPESARSRARVVTAALGIALAATTSLAAEDKLDVYVSPLEFEHRIPPLAIGDPAPRLAVDRWMQGAPITHFEPGTVYVLEFWATWCQPCRKSLPQMDALAKRYAARGVQVIGVAAAEGGGPAPLKTPLEEEKLSHRGAVRQSSDMDGAWGRSALGRGL